MALVVEIVTARTSERGIAIKKDKRLHDPGMKERSEDLRDGGKVRNKIEGEETRCGA